MNNDTLPVNYFERFFKIWLDCMTQGFTTVDARNYAELELRSRLFHD